MKANIEEHEGFAVVRLRGKITIGEGDLQLRHCLNQTSLLNYPKLILDMSRVTYMDSAGLGELIQIHQAFEAMGRTLCLANINPKIYGLLHLTRLVTVFSLFDSVEDAMQSVLKAA